MQHDLHRLATTTAPAGDAAEEMQARRGESDRHFDTLRQGEGEIFLGATFEHDDIFPVRRLCGVGDFIGHAIREHTAKRYERKRVLRCLVRGKEPLPRVGREGGRQVERSEIPAQCRHRDDRATVSDPRLRLRRSADFAECEEFLVSPWRLAPGDLFSDKGDVGCSGGLFPVVPAFTDVAEDAGELIVVVGFFERNHEALAVAHAIDWPALAFQDDSGQSGQVAVVPEPLGIHEGRRE